jgi:hypothetical protein
MILNNVTIFFRNNYKNFEKYDMMKALTYLLKGVWNDEFSRSRKGHVRGV